MLKDLKRLVIIEHKMPKAKKSVKKSAQKAKKEVDKVQPPQHQLLKLHLLV